MQHKQSKASKPSADRDEEDDYENDFEDYDDDFETSEDVKVAPPKQSVAPPAPSKIVPSQAPPQRSAEVSVPSNADAKRVSANSGMSAKASRSGIGSSLSRSMVDPRSVRIQRILASNVLDMKVERATFLNILPSTKYDLYLNEIRSADAKLKQMGVPTDLEIREIEVNTDEILTSDKEVQFCDGDDTKFLNTLSAIKQKKRKEKAETKDVGIQDTRRETQERHDAGSGSQLSEFLRKSSLAIESLLTESRQQKASSKPEDRDFKMLSEKLPWKEAGRDGKNGANELLRNRSTSLIKFSEYQTDVFLTIHPFSDSDSEDLRPFKTLIGIWHTENLGGPQYILEGSGDICSACFSSTQSHFILGGTKDGCLYLWDLREPSSSHHDRDSIDLKIQKGVRKPSFSTHFALSTSDIGDGQGDDERTIHDYGILDLVSPSSSSLMGSSVSSSQFISLDQKGKVIFWLTQESSSGLEDSQSALQISPWSSVTLVATKVLSSFGQNAPSSPRSSSRTATRAKGANHLLGEGSFLQPVPDESYLLCPEKDGKISKISRIGEPASPPTYSRSTTTEHIEGSKQKSSSQIDFPARVTCMALRSVTRGSKYPALMLVGRADGSVDLFQLDQQYPLLSWNMGNLLSTRNMQLHITKQNIVHLRWLPFSRSSFVVIDGSGTLHHFDLLMDVYKPFRSESLGLQLSWKPGVVDISFPKSHVDTMHVACHDIKRHFKISVRPMNVAQSSGSPAAEENALFDNLSRSTVLAAQEKHVVLGNSTEAK